MTDATRAKIISQPHVSIHNKYLKWKGCFFLCMNVWGTALLNYSLSWLKGPCRGNREMQNSTDEFSHFNFFSTLNFLVLKLGTAMQM